MDESWRMRIGLNLPRRRSTEETSTHHHRVFDFGFNTSNPEPTLDPQDFNDVFGGPPQTVLSRKNSATDFNFASNLYQDVFRSSENVLLPTRKARNLPVFSIPAIEREEGRRKGVYQRSEGFYDDIFGSDEDRRSRSRSKGNLSKSKSKSNSSSVLSSEDLSPLRPSFAEDVFFTSFTSKLRPVNIPSERSLSSTSFQEHRNIQVKSDTPPWLRPPLAESHFVGNNLTKNCKSSPSKLFRSGSSPETITIERNSHHSIRASVMDIEIDSPSSIVSSLCNRDPESKSIFQDKGLQEEEDDEEEEIMSSYVIEISSEKRKGVKDESIVAIDEAIAWAKETFQRQSSEGMSGGCVERQRVSPSAKDLFTEKQGRLARHEHCNQQRDGHGRAQFLMVNEKLRSWITEENQKSEKDAGWV